MIYRYIKESNGLQMGFTTSRDTDEDYIKISPLFSSDKRYYFLDALRILLMEGYDIYSSISIMANSNEYKKERVLLNKIKTDMENGVKFSKSLELNTDLPSYYINFIRASESSGNIYSAISKGNEAIKRLRDLKDKLLSGLSYPIFLATMSLIMLVVIANFVLPSFGRMFEGFGGDLPSITKIAIGIGSFISNNFIKLFSIIIAIAIVYFIFNSFSPRFSYMISYYKYNISPFKEIRRDLFLEFFFRQFEIIYDQVFNAGESLGIIAKSESDLYLRDKLIYAWNRLSEGYELKDALSSTGLFSEIALASIESIKKTGLAGQIAGEMANSYKESYDNRLNDTIKWSGPIVTILVGLILIIMVLGIMLPMFDLSNMI